MKHKIYNNLLGHIVGLTDDTLNILIKKLKPLNKNIQIINLDDLTYEIINSREMKILYKKKLLCKSDKNEIKLYEKKINMLWKNLIENKIEDIIIDDNKLYLCIGFSNYHENIKTFVKLSTPNKFFLELDYYEHAKNIIRYNLDNNRNEIINGTFCLEYLNTNFLVNKRKQFECEYKKMNYTLCPIDKIIITLILEIKLHQYNLRPDILFWPKLATTISGDKIIAYSDLWLALTAQFKSKIEKGYIDNKPYIEGSNLFELLSIPLIISYTQSTYKFTPHITKTNRLYKYILTEKILAREVKTIQIDNIYEYLKSNNILLINN